MNAHVEAQAADSDSGRSLDIRTLLFGVVALSGGVALQWAAVHWAATLGGIFAILLGLSLVYSQLFPTAYAITKREFASSFNSPIAYIVLNFFLGVVGSLFFYLRVFLYNEASMRGLFELTPWVFVFFGPAIAMRLLAEEKKSGTLEILVTLPVRDWEIIVGKFFGAVALLMVGIGLTGVYAATIAAYGDLDPGPVAGGYLGLVLLGATFTAVGLLASSWTSNQIVAFIVSVVLCAMLWMLDDLRAYMPSGVAGFVEYLSVASHHRNLARGVLDVRDIIYYVSIIGLCLYLSKEALASRKWR